MSAEGPLPIAEYAEKAEAWLDEHAERRGPGR